eukprot:TRINITY_DN3755_c0_g1_i1.p1 TRINITY_DN3755_c0_g1~~TRINITY_DN3755_c0_g1_i1.p1  ORF type:complete len:140 (-),score=36.94 TRINITY_DN3755_c0_g1_i1:82-501(-)
MEEHYEEEYEDYYDEEEDDGEVGDFSVKNQPQLNKKKKKKKAAAVPAPAPVEVSPPRRQIKITDVAEVYKKIKNHPGLDSAQFTIGYEDRFTGVEEVEFEAFREDMTLVDVPFHRVRYVKHKNEIIWDKKDGIYHVPII